MATAWGEICRQCVSTVAEVPIQILLVTILATLLGLFVLFSLFIYLVAPSPRLPLPEEKKYRTLAKDGSVTEPQPLPCWLDSLDAQLQRGDRKTKAAPAPFLEPAELFMSVVVPAYNEEDRLTGMLEETVNYLERMYGTATTRETNGSESETSAIETRSMRKRKPVSTTTNGDANGHAATPDRGWEIILVSDGSTDRTEEVAFRFARDHQLSLHPKGNAGPWTPQVSEGVHIPPGTIRVVNLSQNRGKGGAVTHGMRHVRGQYVVFADADGASKFDDLGKLVGACRDVEDARGRGVAVGSRAHMVGSEAVVKRSKLRNFLMHSFHLILWLMTPPKTATVKDTQCGFKLFSRSALPFIVPYMHSEGWIFDVEMLMLAEFAHIPVAEVPIGWREVKGSKLNVLRDSIGMAWGLAVLRAAWSLGVYRQR
ncbi:hypothetical protein N7508_002082 [Penicillium antarcticum]|uniref:uncharacterized protein n=1 Tax=Penicillium antarcticum TaxID=416450 RepID=UPI002393A65D|nr:uncharacterized protein N7508_002082 [Penicillium antarcticum]KAJ5317574.1 hypothetical protein N7508_002082 [Penicillium antarcticum]